MAQLTVPLTPTIQAESTTFGSKTVDAENLIPLGQGLRAGQQASDVGGLGSSNTAVPTGGIQFVQTFSETIQILGIQSFFGSSTFVTPEYFRRSDRPGNVDLNNDPVTLATDTPDDSLYMVSGGGSGTGSPILPMDTYEFSPASVAAGWKYRVRYRVDDNDAGVGAWSFRVVVKDYDSLVTLADVTESASDSGTDGWVTAEEAFVGNLTATRLHVQVTASAEGDESLVRANADVNSDWVNELGATGSVVSSVNNATPSDATYIRSPPVGLSGSSSEYELKFALEEPYFQPLSGAVYVSLINVRYKKPQAGNVLKYSLYSGGALIQSGDVGDSSAVGSFTDSVINVDRANFQLIEDWADMRLVFWVAGGDPGVSQVTKTIVPTATYSFNGVTWDGASAHESADADDSEEIQASTPATAFVRLTLDDYEFPGVFTDHAFKVTWNLTSGGSSQGVLSRLQIRDALNNFVTVLQSNLTSSSSGAHEFSKTLTQAQVQSLKNKVLYAFFDGFSQLVGSNVQIDYVRFEHPETTSVFISDVSLIQLSTARVGVSWFQLEVPQAAALQSDDKQTLIVGDQNDLYEVSPADGSWSEISKVAGSYGGGAVKPKTWSMAQWGDDIIATNYVDPVQIREDNTGDFADMITSTKQPRGQFVIVVNNQVWLLNTAGEAEAAADGAWWSAVDDAHDFDPSVTTQCDFQRLVNTPGQITGGVGGERALIFKRTAMHSAEYVGPPAIYRFEVLSTTVGTPYPRSIVAGDQEAYFFTGRSFAMIQPGGAPEPISDSSIDRMLHGISSQFSMSPGQHNLGLFTLEEHSIYGARDPATDTIWWFYRSPLSRQEGASTAEQHSTALVYNPRTKQWTRVNDQSLICSAILSMVRYDLTGYGVNRGIVLLRKDTSDFPVHATLTSSSSLPSFLVSGTFTAGQQVLITRVRPIYWSDTAYPDAAGSSTATYDPDADTRNYYQFGATVPGTCIHVHSSETPMFMSGDYKNSSSAIVDRDGWFLPRISGEWFRISMHIPETESARTQEIAAFQVEYEVEGR